MKALPKDVTTLGKLLEFRAASMPDRPALYLGEQTVSFLELDRMANRYAHVFVELGIAPATGCAFSFPTGSSSFTRISASSKSAQ